MTAFSVGTDAEVAVETETNEKVAEENCVVLGVTTSAGEEGLH